MTEKNQTKTFTATAAKEVVCVVKMEASEFNASSLSAKEFIAKFIKDHPEYKECTNHWEYKFYGGIMYFQVEFYSFGNIVFTLNK